MKNIHKKVDDLLGDSEFSYITKNLLLTLAANGKVGETAKVIAAYDG
jgi:hypothetical protein